MTLCGRARRAGGEPAAFDDSALGSKKSKRYFWLRRCSRQRAHAARRIHQQSCKDAEADAVEENMPALQDEADVTVNAGAARRRQIR